MIRLMSNLNSAVPLRQHGYPGFMRSCDCVADVQAVVDEQPCRLRAVSTVYSSFYLFLS
jgi:hypothetical protein